MKNEESKTKVSTMLVAILLSALLMMFCWDLAHPPPEMTPEEISAVYKKSKELREQEQYKRDIETIRQATGQ